MLTKGRGGWSVSQKPKLICNSVVTSWKGRVTVVLFIVINTNCVSYSLWNLRNFLWMAKSQLHVKQICLVRITVEPSKIRCDQSIFFFRFSESRSEAVRRAKRGRQPEKEKKSFFLPLPSRAISHARGHLRVSHFARRTIEKRETARSLLYNGRLGDRRKWPL